MDTLHGIPVCMCPLTNGRTALDSVLNLKIRLDIEEVETWAKKTGLQALQKYSAMIVWLFTLNFHAL